ncbi:hypothetical protein EB796_017436 [Bugula neritina]|uniref:CASP2 n=1 Tax=Bugula neritina TaxID=10212 RepID=A0A7J7JD92_BUGNE|nr:hypothetical protein EB796_017436 [Bugula neritina]
MKEVVLDTLWSHLLAKEIFTDEMIEHIQATGAKPSQMQRLLSDLTRRGPTAYAAFLECLIETEQEHVVHRLQATEKALGEKEPRFFTPIMNSTSVKDSDVPMGLKFNPVSANHHSEFSLFSAPTAQPAFSGKLTFSAATTSVSHSAATLPQLHHPANRNADRVSFPPHDTVSLERNKPARTVTLMDAVTSSSTLPTNSTTASRPTMSFTLPPAYASGEITPPQSIINGSCNPGPARRNLSSLFQSPVTQTDNGDGIEIPSHSDSMPSRGIQSTDHPQAVDINPYPQVLGIPKTSGRMKPPATSSYTTQLPADWSSMYKMTSDPRGYCIIINNRYFSGHLKERLGTDVDRDNLYVLFSQLGYKICIQENLTGMEMLLTLRDFAQLPHHKSVDSCVVILLTHGLDGQVYGSDAKLINLSEVLNFFDGNVCPGLQGKPKFFLVQACRGESFDLGFDMPDNGETDMSAAGPASQVIAQVHQQASQDLDSMSKKLPSGSDFLIAYATVPGFVSWRNSEQGSWFIQAMCEVFLNRYKYEDALNMLVEVNNKVATIYESATKHKQMPSPVVLLRKKLYFLPLAES